MRKFINAIEKYLIRLIVMGFIVLVMVQGMMTNDPMRLYLSWGERMEGQSIEFPVSTGEIAEDEDTGKGMQVNSPYAVLVLKVDKFSSLPHAIILVNGEEIRNFKDNEVELKLIAGDVVEIDSTYYNFPVNYRVVNISDNLAYPQKDQVFTCNQGIAMIGKIIVK